MGESGEHGPEEIAMTREHRQHILFYLAISASIVFLVSFAAYTAASYFGWSDQIEQQYLEKSRIVADQMDSVWVYESTGEIGGDSRETCQAVAGRAVAGIVSDTADYTIRYASDHPLGQGNTADEFDTRALEAFRTDPNCSEYWSLIKDNDTRSFRYDRPIAMEESCLSCHSIFPTAESSPGNIVGVLSITYPAPQESQLLLTHISLDIAHFLIMMTAVMVVLLLAVHFIVIRPLKRLDRATGEVAGGNLDVRIDPAGSLGEMTTLMKRFQLMVTNLKHAYDDVEEKVRTRTRELNQANEQLRDHQARLEDMNRELKRNDQFKSDFLAMMSHELKTPLTSLMVSVGYIETDEKPGTDRWEAIQNIKRSEQALHSTIENILDVSRLDAGRMTLDRMSVDVADLADAACAIMGPLAQNKGISLRSTVDEDVPIVMLDPDKVMKIIINLLGNAVKFTPRDGDVKLDISYHQNGQVEGEQPIDARNADEDAATDGSLVICVSDSGIGISEKNRAHVFERFYQVDSSLSRGYGGTGLGLALVKDFAEMHGGTASAGETEGRTEFRVVLPAEKVGDDLQ